MCVCAVASGESDRACPLDEPHLLATNKTGTATSWFLNAGDLISFHLLHHSSIPTSELSMTAEMLSFTSPKKYARAHIPDPCILPLPWGCGSQYNITQRTTLLETDNEPATKYHIRKIGTGEGAEASSIVFHGQLMEPAPRGLFSTAYSKRPTIGHHLSPIAPPR